MRTYLGVEDLKRCLKFDEIQYWFFVSLILCCQHRTIRSKSSVENKNESNKDHEKNSPVVQKWPIWECEDLEETREVHMRIGQEKNNWVRGMWVDKMEEIQFVEESEMESDNSNNRKQMNSSEKDTSEWEISLCLHRGLELDKTISMTWDESSYKETVSENVNKTKLRIKLLYSTVHENDIQYVKSIYLIRIVRSNL